MTDRELMQQALEALESLADTSWTAAFKQRKYDSDEPNENVERERVLGVITALRERLAQPECCCQEPSTPGVVHRTDGPCYMKEQPEQEPVVWMYQDKSTHEVRFQKHMRGFVDHGATYETPLYTTPPRREWRGCAECGKSGGWALYCVECMEKLTQPEQEPVAWNLRYNRYPREGDLLADIHLLRWQEALPQSLNTPSRREWVGLTEEEVSKIIDDEIGFNSCWGPEEQFARAIEAKLKEKNT